MDLDYIVIPTTDPRVSIIGKTALSEDDLKETSSNQMVTLYDAQYILASPKPRKDEKGEVVGYSAFYRIVPMCPFTGPVNEFNVRLESYFWLSDDMKAYESLINVLGQDENIESEENTDE